MTQIEDEVKTDKVQRLGKFEKERKSPRNAIITLSNDWEVRMVLAKSAENRKRMKNIGIHILPALSIEETIRENRCLKKRRESLNNGVTPAQLEIRNFELYMHDVKVQLDDQTPETSNCNQLEHLRGTLPH